MGYRSDVFIAVAVKDTEFHNFNELKTQLLLEKNTRLLWGMDQFTYNEKTGVLYIKEEWVKWNEFIPEIKAIMDFYRYAEDHEVKLGLDGVYIRLGEELDDNETTYFGDGYAIAGMGRSINIEEGILLEKDMPTN